jgi:hypothetical protein
MKTAHFILAMFLILGLGQGCVWLGDVDDNSTDRQNYPHREKGHNQGHADRSRHEGIDRPRRGHGNESRREEVNRPRQGQENESGREEVNRPRQGKENQTRREKLEELE